MTFPVWFIVLADCAFGTAFLTAGYLCAEAAIAGVVALLKHDLRLWLRPRHRLHLAGVVISLIAAVYGVYANHRAPRWRTVRIELPGLPEAAVGSRYVLLSDLHLDRYSSEPRIRELFDAVNQVQPDGIFILGDFIDGRVSNLKDRIGIFAGLHAHQGVYGVLGNHEYFWNFREWVEVLREHGVTILQNESVVLPNGIVLAGCKCSDRKQFPAEFQALSSTWARDGAPVILLRHYPDMPQTAARAGVALQLSAHTHGGLILGLDRLVALRTRGFVSGDYQVDGMPLLVSNGTCNGHSLPMRIGVPAEVIIIELFSASAGEK